MVVMSAHAIWLALALSGNGNVYRCVGAHGEPVFSGQPCNSSDNRAIAAPVPAPDDGWNGACAASADELRDRVAAAFDSGNVNALGALFLWRGYGTRSAYARMRELRTLLKQPLAGIDLVGPSDWVADTAGYGELPAYEPSWLSIDVADNRADGALVEHRYALIERDSCVWLGFDTDVP
jgi:hypothetical protein